MIWLQNFYSFVHVSGAVCTYENWPRAKNCVLCGVLKEATPTRDEQQNISTTPGGGHGHQFHANSPEMSPRNLSESQDTESNWDYERRVRTFRRRLREADWTWLTACMGVVVRNIVENNYLSAYVKNIISLFFFNFSGRWHESSGSISEHWRRSHKKINKSGSGFIESAQCVWSWAYACSFGHKVSFFREKNTKYIPIFF